MKLKTIFAIMLLVFSSIHAIQTVEDKEGLSSSSNSNNQKIGIANPASVYCIEQGGTLKIEKDKRGNEYGLCYFNDGSICEEWALYRGECKKIDKTSCVPDQNKVCIEIYAPVCGIDGKTYSNSCHAESKCVKIAYEGECEKSTSLSDSNIRCIGGKEGERCGVSDSTESIMIKVNDNVIAIGSSEIKYDKNEKPTISVDVESAKAGIRSIEIKPSVTGYGTITSYSSEEKPISAEFTNDLKIQKNSLILVDRQSKEYTIKVLPSEVYEKIAPTVSTKITEMTLQVESSQAVYNIKAEKQTKILGFINTNAEVEYSANAGTGEIKMKKAPWWAFLVGNAFEIQ